MADFDTTDACSQPLPQQCVPGVFQSPVCYQVGAGPVLPGFQSITRLADCTITQVQVLDANQVVVPGAVIVSCPSTTDCCDPGSLCSILQGLPTQVPGIADTAVFVTLAGCFLGVPGGGGGGFPGYGAPVTVSGSLNLPGVSLLVARADHIHRLELEVSLAGVTIGLRPEINFISPAGLTTPVVTVVDVPGVPDRVDITITAQQILEIQEDGGTIAINPDIINFNDGVIATVSSPTITVNLDYGSPTSLVDAAAATAGASVQVLRADAKLQALTAAPVSTAQANAIGVATGLARADHVHRTIVQCFDEGVLTSSRPSLNFIGAAVTVVDNPGLDRADITITVPAVVISVAENGGIVSAVVTTINFRDGVIASGGPATVDIDVAYGGAPPPTGVASAAGAALTVSRSDHTHRTELIVQDAGVTISVRPRINFIDGAGITVTVADDVPGDRANITIASSTGMTGFAIPSVAADAAAATAGVATTAIRSDAKLSIATAAPVTVSGTVNSIGVATTIARSDHIHRLGVEVQEEGVLTATRPRLNFIGAAVTVTDDAGGDRANITITAGAAAFIQRFTFQADQFDSPVNANWAVNSLAPAAADSVNAAITVRRFDDTTEEGVGGLVTVPPGAVNVNFIFKWRAQTAPGAAAGVQPTYYTRSIPDNAAVGAWSAAVNFTALAVPTNANFQYDNQVISLATLGWTVNTLRQFEITRRGTQAGDTLAGDWVLAELILEFTT